MPDLLHIQHDLHLVCLGPVPRGHDLCQLQYTLLGVQWQCIRVHSLFYRLPLWIVLRRLLSNWNLPQWQHVFGL